MYYENDTENKILLGQKLISEGIASLWEGITADMLTLKVSEKDETIRLYRIQDMTDDLDRIRRTYRADLADYERHLKNP